MDNGYAVLSEDCCSDTCKVTVTDGRECFICRDGEATEPLRTFCDCKTLLAHHSCLLTWISKGAGSDDRLRCSVCRVEYQLQRRAVWRAVALQWKTWPILLSAAALFVLVPYLVYRLLTTFPNTTHHTVFRVASVCFGLLSIILLIKCVASCLGRRYRQAQRSAFSLLPRPVEREEGEQEEKKSDAARSAPWWGGVTEATAVAQGSRTPEGKQEEAHARAPGLGLKL
ncbi:hypothetical protein AALO_G00125620 [Alosa alosa]|uniref:RING-CH-type domain-containing protein n=1 Tax=Alosa alosa TaxID=278164 RepID=A0AAV6GQR2_9TELE|nr:uncharacterized protein LOC125300035 isoform X1 [Alosa alosa]KAG5275886.1 hypothetical protein AALO_G00125620 [Alosa alosa]